MTFQVYIFQNKLNNKIYIGKSVNFLARVKQHVKNAKNNKEGHFYAALRKYGIEQFNYFVIEEYSSKMEMNEGENFWIEYFRSWDRTIGYNLTFGGEGEIPTNETREKMRLAKLGKPNPKMQGSNHPLYGVTGEQHHRFGTHHTDEAKKKIAEANVGREFSKGSDQYNSKVNEENVLYMRQYFVDNSHLKTKDIFATLSEKFGVTEGTVESIVYGKSWKHVTMMSIPNKNKKITKQNIINIRNEMMLAKHKPSKRIELAAKYGISTNYVYEIETYRKWKNE